MKRRVDEWFDEFDSDRTNRLEASEVREILKRENAKEVEVGGWVGGWVL